VKRDFGIIRDGVNSCIWTGRNLALQIVVVYNWNSRASVTLVQELIHVKAGAIAVSEARA